MTDEYDRAMEWVDSIDPADMKPVDAHFRARMAKTTDPLAALRLEVERLRDAANRRFQEQGWVSVDCYIADAYEDVLDLIDKQREGQ